MPSNAPAGHEGSEAVLALGRLDAPPQDVGGWSYVNNPRSRDFGNVFVNCTHSDGAGKSWDSY